MAKLTVKGVDLKDKKVLVRVDFNMPLEDDIITNDNRISAALPVVKYITEQGGRAIFSSRPGCVKEGADKESKSLASVVTDLAAKFGQEVIFPGVTHGAELEEAINNLRDGEVPLVESTRFEDVDSRRESKSDPELGKYWASLDNGIFVNGAFSTVHRTYVSNIGISADVKKAVTGFLLESETTYIQEAIEKPVHPFIAILGGSKVSDKIGVIENLLKKTNKILIGGGMIYTFLKAQGTETGNSSVEGDKLDVARGPLAKADGKLVSPIDSKEANALADYTEVKDTEDAAVDARLLSLDIGPESIARFDKELTGAKTVAQNGPTGVSENLDFRTGTIGVMDAIAKQPGVKSIIDGSDSTAVAISLGRANKFSWIPTGGGASMELLGGKVLPGLIALTDK